MNTDFALYSQFDQVVSHFDGNNRDPDDIAGLPIAAALIGAAGLQEKSTFFYNNNIGQPNVRSRVKTMRKGAAFAERLGIETHDYQEDLEGTTQKLVDIFNSGKEILVLEGGRMEMTYRALELTNPGNLGNITLVSHSSANEDYDLGGSRTWDDLQRDFPQVNFTSILDQNGGFNSSQWQWLDSTTDPLLQEVRSLMQNAGHKVDDPSDAGMHFYALTGNEMGDPIDAKNFFDEHLSSQNPIEPASLPPVSEPVVTPEPTPEPVGPPEITPPDTVLEPTPPIDGSLLTLALVDTDIGRIIEGYEDLSSVSQIDLSKLSVENYSIVAQPGSSAIKSVKFETAAGDRTENVKPYALFGDDKGTFTGQELSDGDYQIKATAYSETGGGGQVLSTLTVSYEVLGYDNQPGNQPSPQDPVEPVVVPEPTPEPVDPPEVTPPDIVSEPIPSVDGSLLTLALLDADTGKIVEGYEDLSSVSQIDLSELSVENYSVVAQPGSSEIKSVKFETAAGDRTENVKPYALFGDRQGTFTGQELSDGDYQIKATAYSETGGGGQLLSTLTVSYEVLNLDAQPGDTSSIHDIAHNSGNTTTDLGMIASSGPDIIGTDGNDVLVGDSRSQKIVGKRGKDMMIGVDVNAEKPGFGEKDILIGGIAADVYALGNASGVFYDDGDINSVGTADFAEIRGFSTRQDIIQLHGKASDYHLGTTTVGGEQDLALFLKTAGKNELIALIQKGQQADISLESSSFEFVS